MTDIVRCGSVCTLSLLTGRDHERHFFRSPALRSQTSSLGTFKILVGPWCCLTKPIVYLARPLFRCFRRLWSGGDVRGGANVVHSAGGELDGRNDEGHCAGCSGRRRRHVAVCVDERQHAALGRLTTDTTTTQDARSTDRPTAQLGILHQHATLSDWQRQFSQVLYTTKHYSSVIITYSVKSLYAIFTILTLCPSFQVLRFQSLRFANHRLSLMEFEH